MMHRKRIFVFVFDGFVSCFSASVFGVLLFVNLCLGFFMTGLSKFRTVFIGGIGELEVLPT